MQQFSSFLRYGALALTMTLFVGCGKQPQFEKIPGIDGPKFNVLDGKILISVTFENLEMMGGARLPLPKLPNSFMELGPAQLGGTILQVGLDPQDLDNTDWSLVDPHALPGGRALPGVQGGQLPSIAVQVPDLGNTTFYAAKQVFGFFVPFNVDSQGGFLTVKMYMDGKYVGLMSLVGNDQKGENGGLLLLMNLNKEEKARLKSLVDFSKRKENRGKIF